MMLKKIALVALILSVICLGIFIINKNSTESFNPDKKISPENLKVDFDFMLKEIKTTNPDPYHNTSKFTIEEIARSIRQCINKPMTGMEFYRLIRPLISSFNDGHLSIYPDVYYDAYEKNKGMLFPFKVLIADQKIFIKESFLKSSVIPNGSTVQTINNIKADTLLKMMLKFYSGDSDPYKLGAVEKNFSVTLWRAFGFTGPFKIVLSNGKSFTLPGVPAKAIDESLQIKAPFELTLLKQQTQPIAYMRISSLVFDKKKDMDSFLVSSFEKIKSRGCKNLIIDIRSNPGGSTLLAREIFSYITTNPYSLSWEEISIENGHLVKVEDGKNNLTKPNDKPNKFKGKVYLLVNAATYSSAHMMANTFKFYKLGITIGDSSSERRVISGEINAFNLPNTLLNVYCPTSIFILPYEFDKRSRLVPDHLIPINFDDKLKDRDTQLNFCLKLISQTK